MSEELYKDLCRAQQLLDELKRLTDAYSSELGRLHAKIRSEIGMCELPMERIPSVQRMDSIGSSFEG
jgi:hypothetical protein